MEHACKTCGHTYTLNYCNKCGQKVIEKRFTTKELFHELFHNMIHIDRGFFYTMYSLLIRPHVVIKEYLNGATRKYANPAQFAIYLIAISTFILVQQDYLEKNNESFNRMIDFNDPKGIEVQKAFIGFIKHYLQYFNLLLIPFFALASRWLFRKHNYAEHLVLHCFVFGLLSIVSLPFTLFMNSFGVLRVMHFLLIILFYAYVFRKLYSITIFKSVTKSILFYISGYIIYVLTFSVALLGYMFVHKQITGSIL